MNIAEKNVYGIRLILLIMLFAGFAVSSLFAKDTCVECHKDEKFRVQNKVLYDYFMNWKDSVHDLTGVTCVDCHGGDPTKSSKDAAHKYQFSSLGYSDKEAFKRIPEVCGKCHDSVLQNFVRSKHYEALVKKGKGPQCVTCHGSMNAEVYYTSVIARACKDCHNEYTKNRPEVVGEADMILHRINVSRAFRNWIITYYADREPEKVNEINKLYTDIANSWHTFNFTQLDENSLNLLNKSKSLVNIGLKEKRKKIKE